MTTFHCAHAALPEGVRDGVRIEVDGERITDVHANSQPAAGDVRLPGLVVPGFANAHSHAFHRALRGRTQCFDSATPGTPATSGRGSFWSWREAMYAVSERLDPDSYLRLARAVYAEMALAGITVVGEFHYLHHQAGGVPYDDPNAMGDALVQAAEDAGVRLTLLDACYLQAGPDGALLSGPQQRFGDASADAWAERVALARAPRLGAAIHSVRACSPAAMTAVADWARGAAAPLHLHLSEQQRENAECLDVHGRTPARLAAEAGVLEASATAVHGTHLTDDDVELLGDAHAYACFCPTTERDLGDGIGPAPALADAGARLCLGSDSHAVIDPLEEARGLEMNERLASQRRGAFTPTELLGCATVRGYTSLGWPDGGALTPGALADLVAVRLDSVRLAGAPDADAMLAAVLFAGTAADVSHVVVAGRLVVTDGCHQRVPDVADSLRAAIGAVT